MCWCLITASETAATGAGGSSQTKWVCFQQLLSGAECIVNTLYPARDCLSPQDLENCFEASLTDGLLVTKHTNLPVPSNHSVASGLVLP